MRRGLVVASHNVPPTASAQLLLPRRPVVATRKYHRVHFCDAAGGAAQEVEATVGAQGLAWSALIALHSVSSPCHLSNEDLPTIVTVSIKTGNENVSWNHRVLCEADVMCVGMDIIIQGVCWTICHRR